MKNAVPPHVILAMLFSASLGNPPAIGEAGIDKTKRSMVVDDHWTRQRQRDDKTRDWQTHTSQEAAGQGKSAVSGVFG